VALDVAAAAQCHQVADIIVGEEHPCGTAVAIEVVNIQTVAASCSLCGSAVNTAIIIPLKTEQVGAIEMRFRVATPIIVKPLIPVPAI
jgi:hypothetical protein